MIATVASSGSASPCRARNTAKYIAGATPHETTKTTNASPSAAPSAFALSSRFARSFAYPAKPANRSALAPKPSVFSVGPGNRSSNADATGTASRWRTARRARDHAGRTRVSKFRRADANDSAASRVFAATLSETAPYAEPIATCRSPNSAFARWPWRFQYASENRGVSGSTGSPASSLRWRSAARSARARSRRRAEDLRTSRASLAKFSRATRARPAKASHRRDTNATCGAAYASISATNASTRSNTPKPSRIARPSAVAARRAPSAAASAWPARRGAQGGNQASSRSAQALPDPGVPDSTADKKLPSSAVPPVCLWSAATRSSRSISARARSSSSLSADAIAAWSSTSTGSSPASTTSATGGGVADSSEGVSSGDTSSLGERASGSSAFAVSGVASTVECSIAGSTVESASGLESPASHEPCIAHDASCAETRPATSASASTARSVARRAIVRRGGEHGARSWKCLARNTMSHAGVFSRSSRAVFRVMSERHVHQGAAGVTTP